MFRNRAKITSVIRMLVISVLALSPVVAGEVETLVALDAVDLASRKAVGLQNAQVSRLIEGDAAAILVKTGTQSNWPGITLKAPKGCWDLSRKGYLTITLGNRDTGEVKVFCRIDNPGGDGRKNCVTESVTIPRGEKRTVTVPLFPRRYAEKDITFIGMRGNPKVLSKLDPARINQVLIFLVRPSRPRAFSVEALEAGGTARTDKAPADPNKFFPMIDIFGQYRHADWPGKIHSLDDLKGRARKEAADLKTHPGPKDRTQYGGWSAGPQLAATGFFRVTRHKGKWWLVDPEGRLFWSHGVDCVRYSSATPITDRKHYYEALPGKGTAFAQFYGWGSWAPHGYYKDRGRYESYDFRRANLLRKYGPAWQPRFAELAHQRLRSWGMNTIANWSDSRIFRMRKTPYVATIWYRGPKLEGSTGYWGKFYDVFDPAFKESIRKGLARERGASAGDPWCLGYFVDNELGWGDDVSLAVAALASPEGQPAKQAFIGDLKKKYGAIAKLNAAWGTQHATWDALARATDAPDRKKAKADLEAFYTKTAETYFRVVRDAVKAAAPNQLYLGCRFAWVNDRAARAAVKYCDVVGYNRYQYSVADFKLPAGCDKPVIIGEFHFGALDRGMFHTGLRKARDQVHRAALYKDYVQGALRNPLIVGTHWFQFGDQATTGRGDGENYQIGFLDIGDTPYPEIVAAARALGDTLYGYRLNGK